MSERRPPRESLSEQLRRLRRDGESSPVAPATDDARRAAPPAWLRRQLASVPAPEDASLRTLGEPRGLVVQATPAGEIAAREERYARDHVHGEWALSEIDAAEADALALVAKDASCAELDLTRAVYLDIETTGLSGGAGTVSFLVALGRFDADGFGLWQGFLRHPGEEPALLAEIAGRIAEADGVVSFFGKSFDRHRLEDKMRVFGVEPPFDGRAHLDLYWPLLRLYGGALPDGRLATCERTLCGLEREDDLPGSRAPEAWFDFLAGRGHRLEGVFEHNRDDVLSLVTLAAHVGRTLREERRDGRPLSGCGASRAAALGRLTAASGDLEGATRWTRRALERERGPARALAVELELAELLRRRKCHDEALERLRRLVPAELDGHPGDPRAAEVAVLASIALAKILEHQRRDACGALEVCRRARTLAERRLTGAAFARATRDLDRRATRLAARAAGERGA